MLPWRVCDIIFAFIMMSAIIITPLLSITPCHYFRHTCDAIIATPYYAAIYAAIITYDDAIIIDLILYYMLFSLSHYASMRSKRYTCSSIYIL